jgi:hypothetical protein
MEYCKLICFSSCIFIRDLQRESEREVKMTVLLVFVGVQFRYVRSVIQKYRVGNLGIFSCNSSEHT